MKRSVLAAYGLPDSFLHIFDGDRFRLPFKEWLTATCRRTRGPLFAQGYSVWPFQGELQPVTAPDSQFCPKLLRKGYFSLVKAVQVA